MLKELNVEELAIDLRGRLILTDDPDYDDVRAIWNGMIDRLPAAIARCKGAADVRAAVNFARLNGLPFSVKAGGHGVSGKAICDDGLVIDVSSMNTVQVDPATQTAKVGPGATWGDFDREAQSFGLATTGGVDSRTGVAGLTLGGGIGYLARKHGLSIDNLLAVDVVTADGELRHASKTNNPDLFWALRGGGGNVGIVTSFEFKLHEVGPEVLVGQSFHSFDDARKALRFYREFTTDAPNELACYALVVHIPPVEPFPESTHGQIAVALVACYAGPLAEAEAAIDPLKAFGNPILSFVQPMPYTTLQSSFDAGTPDGERYYYKSQTLGSLSDEAIDTIVSQVEPLPGPFTMIGIEPMGGAISRVNPAATAYPHRDAAYNFSVWAGWSDSDNDDHIIAWTRNFHQAMVPHASGGAYANYLAVDDGDRLREAYGANYDRLLKIKKAWDPDRLFSPAL